MQNKVKDGEAAKGRDPIVRGVHSSLYSHIHGIVHHHIHDTLFRSSPLVDGEMVSIPTPRPSVSSLELPWNHPAIGLHTHLPGLSPSCTDIPARHVVVLHVKPPLTPSPGPGEVSEVRPHRFELQGNAAPLSRRRQHDLLQGERAAAALSPLLIMDVLVRSPGVTSHLRTAYPSLLASPGARCREEQSRRNEVSNDRVEHG